MDMLENTETSKCLLYQLIYRMWFNSRKSRHSFERINAETKWPPLYKHYQTRFSSVSKLSHDISFNCQLNNKSSLVWIIAWRRKGSKPFSEPTVDLFTAVFMQIMISTCRWAAVRYIRIPSWNEFLRNCLPFNQNSILSTHLFIIIYNNVRTSHYLNQRWSNCVTWYGVTRSQRDI